MKRLNVIAAVMMCGALLAFMPLPAGAHTPIEDGTACIQCDQSVLNPAYCMFVVTEGPGSECFDPGYPNPCVAVWPSGAWAGMITWDLLVTAEWDPDNEVLEVYSLDEADPFVVHLPAPGTYDFCAWSDQLFCALDPVKDLAEEIERFAYVIMCKNMDINGPLNECFEIPVKSNGIPERYELAIVAHVLNNTGHPLHAAATAAMQTNAEALMPYLIEALRAVEVDGNPLDVRGLTYLMGPWMMPALGGLLAASALLGDPLTNIALDELLGLLEDLGIPPPVGGIAGITDSIPATGPNGDISGNGFTNREIFEWFMQVNPAMTVDEFVAKATTPAERPPAKAAITGGGDFYEGGDDITLVANVSNLIGGASPATYQWYKWDVVGQAPKKDSEPEGDQCDVYDWALIPDATGSALSLLNAGSWDSSEYMVAVGIDTGSKAVTGVVKATTAVLVTGDPEIPVPVGSALAITLLAGVCAFAGAVGIRRRK